MYSFVKRFSDLFFCCIFLPFLLPFFIVISLLIKRDSIGPILYVGQRAGLNGKSFGIYKFRTMVLDADKGEGTTGYMDSRVTRIGGLLRRYKLDELPQLLNVLKGDMSLVGPRPELLKYAAAFQGEEKLILTVKPGITDYSSIRFFELDKHVGSIKPEKTFEDTILPIKNILRIQYIKERNVWVDMKILFRTFLALFFIFFSRSE